MIYVFAVQRTVMLLLKRGFVVIMLCVTLAALALDNTLSCRLEMLLYPGCCGDRPFVRLWVLFSAVCVDVGHSYSYLPCT